MSLPGYWTSQAALPMPRSHVEQEEALPRHRIVVPGLPRKAGPVMVEVPQ
jgi:hypothetical protein